MANWCNTEIVINVKDEKEAAVIAATIEDLGEVNDRWNLGIIRNVATDGPKVVVDVDSKWGPELDSWAAFFEENCPEAEAFYYASEPGCEVYETNDPDMSGKYFADINGTESWVTAEEFINALRAEFDENEGLCSAFVEKCVSDGIIDCEEANEFFLEALEDSEFFDEVTINKWDITTEDCPF